MNYITSQGPYFSDIATGKIPNNSKEKKEQLSKKGGQGKITLFHFRDLTKRKSSSIYRYIGWGPDI